MTKKTVRIANESLFHLFNALNNEAFNNLPYKAAFKLAFIRRNINLIVLDVNQRLQKFIDEKGVDKDSKEIGEFLAGLQFDMEYVSFSLSDFYGLDEKTREPAKIFETLFDFIDYSGNGAD